MDWIYTLLTFKLFQAKKNAYDSAKAHEKSEDSNKSAKAKTEKDINKVSGYMAQLLAPETLSYWFLARCCQLYMYMNQALY